ncbi:MAG TPA: substrate-binding domain-containing protein [Burkholderiales bacterium]|nr:substrate-binding domain-containing protein [Burkholderiales bacterium]
MIPACPGPAALRRASLALALLAATAAANPSLAQEDVLRVCQDPNNLPFSNEAGQGFENKIAELLARELGWKLEYFSFPQRMGFIRNTLRFKLPGEQYRCDLVIGVPAGYEQVWPTRPYYRSTYVLIYPQGGKLEGVHAAKDLDRLPPNKLAELRIGVFDRSPASEWLVKHGLLEQAVPYPMLNADPDYSPSEIIEKDLAAGKLDAAIVWGPIAGFVTQRLREPRLILVPLTSEPSVRLDYDIAMGVRYGEREWKAKIEHLLAAHEGDIEQILRAYSVPLLDAQGRLKP